MKYFRGKLSRAIAILMAVIMLIFTPATDYLGVPSGKIESEAASIGGVAIYEVIKYILISLAGSVGVYGLSNVEWKKLIDEYLWSINDTVLPMATFLTMMAAQELQGISQWEGNIIYFPNVPPDDPNTPDPGKKPKISITKKLAAAWTAFLVAKNLTGDSRKPDATEAEQTEYIPESVYSDDYVIKLGSKTASEIFDSSPVSLQNKINSNLLDESLFKLMAYKDFSIDNNLINSILSEEGLLEQYPYWVICNQYLYLSDSPLKISKDKIVKSSGDFFVCYQLFNLLSNRRLVKPSFSSGSISISSNHSYMTNSSLDSINLASFFYYFSMRFIDLSYYSDGMILERPSFYIDSSSGIGFGNNGNRDINFYGFKSLDGIGYDLNAFISVPNLPSDFLSFSYNPNTAYSYKLPFYANLYDYQQANPSITAPVPGLYDPTKSTEDVTFDTDGNFSLEFDNLEESISQLNQKVDAATEADIALDNQLKQELMDYIDSLIQGQVDPAPDPSPNPDPDPNPNPNPDPNPEPEPNPDPEPEPNPNPNPEPTPEDLDPENWKIPLDFKNKFPFSIPWDVYGCLTVLQATETPPVWEVPFVVKTDYMQIEEKIVLDLTKPEYAGMIKIVRAFFLLLFIVSLVMVTRYLIKG